MNVQKSFEDLLTDRLHADAPGGVPGHLLETTMERIAETSQRGRGWLAIPATKLLAAVAVLLLAVLVGTQLGGLIDRPIGDDPSPSPSAPPSGMPSPAATAAPSTSAAPSTPTATPQPTASPIADDGLVLRVVSLGGGPTDPASLLPWASLMADGTVIWQPASSQSALTGFVTRRLSPDGLVELRERIFGGGLLDENATHELEPQPGAEPPGRGASLHTFTVGEGDGQVIVTSVQWLGDEEEASYYQPDPEREALDALAQQLRDPESLVSAEAWAGPAEAYEATDYQLVLTPYRDVPPYGNPDVSEVPIPFEGSLDAYGVATGGDRQPGFRCGLIGRDEAAQIVAALTAMGSAVTNMVGLDRASFASLDWADGDGVVDLYLLPRMPDGYPECDDHG